MPRRTVVVAFALAGVLAVTAPGALAHSPGASVQASRPTVTVTPAKASVTRGKTVKLAVKVKGAKGKVKVYRGAKKVKTLALRKGKATYTTPKTLKRGTHKFRFVHSPSGRSRTVKVVVRSASTMTVSATPGTFYREDAPGKLTMKVTSDGQAVGGVFSVHKGTTLIAQAKAKAGKATVTLPEGLSKGKHTFKVRFAPSSKYVKAPAAKKVTVNVKSKVAFAGDGMFVVGVDVQPGLYLSRDNHYCYWGRHSDFTGTVAAADGGAGNRYIRITASDKVVETAWCNDFIPAPSQKNPATTINGPGVYRVGYDLVPGLYRTDVPTSEYCYWGRLSDATGHVDDIIANDGGEGTRLVHVQATDAFVEIGEGCGAWSRTG